MKRYLLAFLVVALAALTIAHVSAAGRVVGINIVLKSSPGAAALARLSAFGKIRDVIPEIDAVTLQAAENQLAAIRKLPFVESAGMDQPRAAVPVTTAAASDFSGGYSTWNLDAVNVTTTPGRVRTIGYDGDGVYVAVLDTGLLNSWPYYFPADRIETALARSFGGGGDDGAAVPSQPNKWEEDQNSHGTHVTSTIIGYNDLGAPINGVAPMAKIIPVKVLNQNGSGWSSVIARGIVYVADLKADGVLGSAPVVINMSLSGSGLDPLEKKAIDYAVSNGVIIVAAAGNGGTSGMGYPAAYAPVISVAASGWIHEWESGNSWWYADDVADPTDAGDFYITDFSSRAKAGQDLDVAAPGSWVVGPYQTNGQISYYFLGGTSMASPHVAGIVALMAQKKNELTAPQAEEILEATAIPIGAGCRTVDDGWGRMVEMCWGPNATGHGLVDAAAAVAKAK